MLMATTRPIRVAPSLLSADFGHLAAQIGAVEVAGAEVLHLDVMDGHFVPNLSIGVPVVKSIRQHSRAFLDTHLMIANPGQYAPAFVDAGADSITFHIEVADQPIDLVRQIRKLGAKVGVSLNPGTPVDSVLGVLDEVDIVLVMTVWPGFGGQSFIADCLTKIEALAPRMRADQWLEVDGGLNRDTVPRVVAAGADTLVAGSAVFGAKDAGTAYAELIAVAEQARSQLEQTA